MKIAKSMQGDKKENQLSYHLHKTLTHSSPGRSHKVVHASSLTQEDEKAFCPRQYALMDILKVKPKDEFLTTSLEVTFELGRQLQDSLVNWMADIGMAITDWKCLSCGCLHEFMRRPVFCSSCGCQAFRPEEHRFKSEKTGASSGIDMMWNNGQMLKNQIVEIKTIDKDKFKSLAAPLAEHRLRTNLYMRIVDESDNVYKDRVNTQEAKIFYISKGAYGCKSDKPKEWGIQGDTFSPFKEFTVTRDDSQTDEMSYFAQRLLEYRKGEKGIPLGICPNSFCKKASGCPVLKECFSNKYTGVK